MAKRTTKKETETVKPAAVETPDLNEDVALFQDADKSDAANFVMASSSVGGKQYTFPLKKASTFNDAMALSTAFTIDLLQDGQEFSMNPRLHAFLFLEELGISLNDRNYKWTYQAGNFDSSQLGMLLHVVRSGSLVVGDLELKCMDKRDPKVGVDPEQVLSPVNFDTIRNSVRDLLGKRNRVLDSGQIEGPGIDLKALLAYEQSKVGKHRPKVIDLINRALGRIRGMVEYTDQFTNVEERTGDPAKVDNSNRTAPMGSPEVTANFL